MVMLLHLHRRCQSAVDGTTEIAVLKAFFVLCSVLPTFHCPADLAAVSFLECDAADRV